MRFKFPPVFVLLFMLTGCTGAFAPPPLTTDHPAHPGGMASPEPPSSKTLAYDASEGPFSQPPGSSAEHEMRHNTQPAQSGGQADIQTVTGIGKVIAVIPDSRQIVVDHQEIKGFMGAMTMGYRVDPPSLLEGVKAGDAIRFTIDTRKNAIIKIEKLSR